MGKTGGGPGTNQYQVRGTASNGASAPGTNLMVQMKPAATKRGTACKAKVTGPDYTHSTHGPQIDAIENALKDVESNPYDTRVRRSWSVPTCALDEEQLNELAAATLEADEVDPHTAAYWLLQPKCSKDNRMAAMIAIAKNCPPTWTAKMRVFDPVFKKILAHGSLKHGIEQELDPQQLPQLIGAMSTYMVTATLPSLSAGYRTYFETLLAHPAAPAGPVAYVMKRFAAGWLGLRRLSRLPSMTGDNWRELISLCPPSDATPEIAQQWGTIGIAAPLLPNCPSHILAESWEEAKRELPVCMDMADINQWEGLFKSAAPQIQMPTICLGAPARRLDSWRPGFPMVG